MLLFQASTTSSSWATFGCHGSPLITSVVVLAPFCKEKKTLSYCFCVPVNKQFAITLWRLATNSEYQSVSHLFCVHCVQDFCNGVRKVLLPKHIKTADARKLMKMATFFNIRWRATQCVGSIDGSSIPIIAPELHPCDYHNRKGWDSIILQAVFDEKGLFWDVCVGYLGMCMTHECWNNHICGKWWTMDSFSANTLSRYLWPWGRTSLLNWRPCLPTANLADEAFLWYRQTDPAATEVQCHIMQCEGNCGDDLRETKR